MKSPTRKPKTLTSNGAALDSDGDNQAVINLVVGNTKTLLEDYWGQILSFRQRSKNGELALNVGLAHELSFEGSERTVKSTLTFSQRSKHSIENSVDVLQQKLL